MMAAQLIRKFTSADTRKVYYLTCRCGGNYEILPGQFDMNAWVDEHRDCEGYRIRAYWRKRTPKRRLVK